MLAGLTRRDRDGRPTSSSGSSTACSPRPCTARASCSAGCRRRSCSRVLQTTLFLLVAFAVRRALPRRGARASLGAIVLAAHHRGRHGRHRGGDRAADRLAVAAAEPVPVHVRAAVHRAGVLPAGAADAGAAATSRAYNPLTYVVEGDARRCSTATRARQTRGRASRRRCGLAVATTALATFALQGAPADAYEPSPLAPLAPLAQRGAARARRAAARDDRAGRSSCSASPASSAG